MFAKRIFAIATVATIAMNSAAFGQLDLLPSIQKGSISVGLHQVVAGMGAPNYAINSPGDPSRLFVVEQRGEIRVVQNNALLPTPALNLSSTLGNTTFFNPGNRNDERGFLGLTFHPGYDTPSSPGYRTLYTFSSAPYTSGNVTYEAPNTPNNTLFPGTANPTIRMVVNEWKRDAADPNVIDPTSRREVFSYAKVAGNHNGGTIAFGPDGYMYLGTGDGGNAYDLSPVVSGAIVGSHIEPGGNAVNLATPLGKMLRFDPLNPALNPTSLDQVSGNGQYRIPTANPFQGANQVKETYAYGLRNPYRFAFDDRAGGTGNLIAADVGQGNIEEINNITLGGNYGWRNKEGTFGVNFTPAATAPFQLVGSIGADSPEGPGSLIIDPIKGSSGGYLQYDHQDGISITGGFVYRGTEIPDLIGKYVFGDLAIRSVGGVGRIDGRLFYADMSTGIINEFLIPQFINDQLPGSVTVNGFGQDYNGELYALVTNTSANGTGGIIYRFVSSIPEPNSGLLLLVAASGAYLRRRR
jgi:Glucose / Sorbosone dehydrogenase